MFILGSLFFVIGETLDVGTKLETKINDITLYCQQKTTIESFSEKVVSFAPSGIEYTAGFKFKYKDIEFKIEEVCGHKIDSEKSFDAPVNSWEFSIKKTNYNEGL